MLKNDRLEKINLPPCAKQTLSRGNRWRTPPNIMQQIDVVVSAGIPTSNTNNFILNKRDLLRKRNNKGPFNY